MRELWICHLGRVEYREAAALQEELRERVQAGELPDVLLLLEHPPVYTLGRRSEPGDLPMGEDWYRAQGIDVVRPPRGGKLTYHGPGQLVGYPIMRVGRRRRLRARDGAGDRRRARRGGHRGARARHEGRYTGVWVEDRKIASIGVHISRGVTTHGFAVNVDNDLAAVQWVSPAACRRAHDFGAPRDGAGQLHVLSQAHGVRATRRRSAGASGSSRRERLGAAARPVRSSLDVTRPPHQRSTHALAREPRRDGRREGARRRTSRRSASASRRGSRCRRPAARSTAS